MEGIRDFYRKWTAKWPELTFDILSIPLAWYLAFVLRFNLQPWPNAVATWYACYALGALVIFQLLSYFHFKSYRGVWRFSSVSDLARIIKATVCATLLEVPLLYFSSFVPEFPRSILPLYCLILITVLCSARLIVRAYWDRRHHEQSQQNGQRVLIVGAGQAGESLVRDLKRSQAFIPVGLIDDRQKNSGFELHGVRVLGGVDGLPYLVQTYQIDLVIIAIPSATSAEMRRIVDFCERSKVLFRTLPSLQDLALGLVEVNALRKVNLDDLLCREPVRLQWNKIGQSIQSKRIIVTGGGGSIGSELCRQILMLQPAAILIIEHSEYNLYKIDQELTAKHPHARIEKALLSVTDKVGIQDCFQRFRPELVFHAAAYKHVPMVENQIRSAVLNNVIGTQIVALASVAANVEKFILISTDKAVNPTNVMGATKRIAEIYCQNMDQRTETQFITVRFGNVLGSVGSVVPLFQQQLEQGGPLTVTHPDIERYFMTISEACQLILQAMVNGVGGEIFVLDMGEPIKITYLAEQMIRLAGKTLGKDIQIEYTGLRPGEKLYEELFHENEALTETTHEKLFTAKFRVLPWDELEKTLLRLQYACEHLQHADIRALLQNLVPEFSSSKEIIC